jgi:glutamate-5-semialdehyde dehydrogenase
MKTVTESSKAAKDASAAIALLNPEAKNRALLAMADALINNTDMIVEKNALDMTRGRESGTPEPMLDRLMLSAERVADMAEGLRQVAALLDPIGEVIEKWTRPNGLVIEKIRVPMGVIGMIYEARPNVTADAAALAFKAGSAILLRGSSSAFESNAALVHTMRAALEKEGITPDAVCLVEDPGHDAVLKMLKLREYIDLIVPREVYESARGRDLRNDLESDELRRRAEALGGYDLNRTGQVVAAIRFGRRRKR